MVKKRKEKKSGFDKREGFLNFDSFVTCEFTFYTINIKCFAVSTLVGISSHLDFLPSRSPQMAYEEVH